MLMVETAHRCRLYANRTLISPNLLLSGLLTSLRFRFAFFGLDERYGDIKSTVEPSDCRRVVRSQR
jgi:hypothetical protein